MFFLFSFFFFALFFFFLFFFFSSLYMCLCLYSVCFVFVSLLSLLRYSLFVVVNRLLHSLLLRSLSRLSSCVVTVAFFFPFFVHLYPFQSSTDCSFLPRNDIPLPLHCLLSSPLCLHISVVLLVLNLYGVRAYICANT
jgi:hypothetical protein